MRRMETQQIVVIEVTDNACMAGIKRLVNHWGFEFFFAFVILTNSGFLGFEVDWAVNNPKSPFAPIEFYIVGVCYTLVFLAELCLRVVAGGRRFFCGPGKWWGWFDFVIVVASLYE